MTTSLVEILELGEYETKLHPTAVKHYRNFLYDISKDIPLDSITEDDVKEYLSNFDFWAYQSDIKSLTEWLSKCVLTNDEYTLKHYPDSFPIWGTFGFKDLLLKVYRIKTSLKAQQQAEANARKQVYVEQRRREQEKVQAIAEHKQWLANANNSWVTLKTNLSKNTAPKFQTPVWLNSYSPSKWVKQLPCPTTEWFNLKNKIPILANKLTLDNTLRNHLHIEFHYWDFYLPSVEYELVIPPPVSVKGHCCQSAKWDTF